jgi:hypothetical protein
MADNVELSAGTGGAIAATDDIAGVHYQRVKVTFGADGAATDVAAAAPLPVDIGTGATGAAKAEDAAAASGDVGVPVLTVRQDTIAGSTSADGDYQHLKSSSTGRVYTSATVDAALPAGDNNIGNMDIASIAAGDNNIGNVDVATVPADPFGANADAASATGSISAKLRFIAATGIPITGTVTVGSHAVTNAGTFVTQIDGAALTALQLIDNIVAVEDAVAGSGYSGVPLLVVRQDSQTALAADGDFISPTIDSAGGLRVSIVAGAGSGGTAAADDADFTDGTTQGTPAMGVYESTPSTVTDGDLGVVGITENRELKVAVSSGGIAGATEDAVASGTAEGILGIVVRDDALASLTPADGDYTVNRVNARGAMWVALDSTAAQTVTLAAGTATNEVVGDAAHDAAIAGNPVRIAGRALTSDYTAVAAGDTADLITTLTGKLVTMPFANPANTWSYAAASGGIVNTTGVTARAAGAAGVRNYITHVDVVNGHATVSTDVQIRDGAAGTVLWRGFAQAAGGGVSAEFNPPLRGSTATLVEIACGTTGTATYFNLTGFAAAE